MPDTRSLTPLFEAIAHQDWECSRASALEIVANEESKGNRKAARTLRGALNGFGANGPVHQNPEPQQQNGEFLISQALVRCSEGLGLDEVAMTPLMRKELREIVEEWEAADVLEAAGIPRRSTLLFYGPPGCGKSICASAIAKEFGVPAYLVRFNALIGSYLGQTALNLREVFRFVARNRCVLLLDEIDVLGKRRGSQMDVGELDRIVVGLMQELDLTKPKGLIIGASNLSSQLDEALWRRFDLHMEFPKPKTSELLSYVQALCKRYRVSLTVSLKEKVEMVGDYASAEKLIVDEARRAVLSKHKINAKRAIK